MPPGISPETVQRLFPFIQKLGNWTREMQMGRNFEHAVEANPRVALSGLRELVEPAATKQPWAAFKQSVMEEPFVSKIQPFTNSTSSDINFQIRGEGSPSGLGVQLKKSFPPDTAKLAYLESQARGRDLPFGERSASMRPKGIPPVAMSMDDRRRAFDELLSRAHKSGINTVTYEAQPGGRPALYEKMTSKRQKQTSHDTGGWMEDYKFSTDPQKDLPLREPRVEPVPPWGPARVQWARRLSLGTPLRDEGVEMALLMDPEEAIGHGLAVRVGNLFKLTHSGIEEVRKALREMGGL